ncbi:hypothetical protein [Homoserinimonas sp. OAct 916]|uniref:hypothetical protein n=1 Tax=Homoserinimonas sp. OAct 916 TaxID=2211450 RepID=UPI000DBE6840|nr:hypothetical protein [Homoserinimonas sp. OAct 916]
MSLQMLLMSALTLAAPVVVALGILTHLARRNDPVGQAGMRALGRESFRQWSRLVSRYAAATRVICVLLFAAVLVRFFVIEIQYVLSDLLGTGFVDHWGWGFYAFPVATASLGVLAHTWLTVDHGATAADGPITVTLEPRTTWSFASTPWIVTWVASATVLVTTVVTAGLIADVDDEGRHAALSTGTGALGGHSEFLGWYYGVPMLIAVAALAAVTVVSLTFGARGPIPATASTGRTVDIVLRTLGARAILSMGAGAMLVATGLSWTFISSAVRLQSWVDLGSAGTVRFDTGLAGLSWWLQVGAWLFEGLGFAALLLPAVTRRPTVREEGAPAGSESSGELAEDSSALRRAIG